MPKLRPTWMQQLLATEVAALDSEIEAKIKDAVTNAEKVSPPALETSAAAQGAPTSVNWRSDDPPKTAPGRIASRSAAFCDILFLVALALMIFRP